MAIGTEPHHDGSPLYVSDLTPDLGDLVRVRVRLPADFGPVEAVRVRSTPNREPRFAVATRVASVDGWDWWEAVLDIENPEFHYRFLIRESSGRHSWLNATGLHDIETLDSDDFTIIAYPAAPDWAASTVLYQVFPDRFARSSAAGTRALPDWAAPAEWSDDVINIGPDTPLQFFGGDLAGIEEHLDHLERLGVTMLYLTPIFPAGSNHRYDAESFDRVDPLLGGDEALISLVRAAHARGIRVLGDLTVNHSGDTHEWFRAAHGQPGAPESDYYYWLDDEQTRYEAWLGVPSLPKLNWNSHELRERFIEGGDSVVAKWLKPPFDLDGWRIDAANMTGRHLGDDLNGEVRRIIRQTMIDVNSDTILLAESTNDATSDFQGDAWHGAMTYANFTRPVWAWLSEEERESSYFGLPFGTIPRLSGEQAYATHRRFVDGFPWRIRLTTMNALDTHDTPRFLTHAIEGALPVAFGLCVALPGIPVIFAGDEFGLVGDDGEHSRTPIPWDAADDAAPTIDLFASLVHLRTAHPALNGGGMRWLHAGPEVLVFVREAADECVLVVAARAGFVVELPRYSVAGEPVRVYGTADAAAGGTGIRLSGSGPSFSAFTLPGISLPDFAPPGTVLGVGDPANVTGTGSHPAGC